MKNIIKTLLLGMAVFGVTTLSLAVLNTGTAVAHGDEVHADEAPRTEAKPADGYAYEAQSGDTYSQMARKAVQTYGIENKVNLSGAQIVFAETNLTLEAGSPVLNLGQKVTVPKDSVKKWVEAAQKLDSAAQGRWNYYVQFVDFNTNSVGEKKR